jgi:uncharacterized protein
MTELQERYRSLSNWLKQRFNEPVRKITLDAGLGCPNRDGTIGVGGCIYCNARGSGTGMSGKGASLERQIREGIDFLSRRYKCRKFIAYFQSYTNTYAPMSKLRDIYSTILKHSEIVGVSIGTRPDCAPDDVLDLISDLFEDRLVFMEYGLQSANPKTLGIINRGHSPEAFSDAARRSGQRGMEVVAHLILGLPGETKQDVIDTARFVNDSGVTGVKLHPLYVVKGTGLEELYNRGSYTALTEEDAVDLTLTFLEALSPETVIHRLTSDPHPQELVAPLWMLDKAGVRSRLIKRMEIADVRQGSKCEAGP